MTVAFDVTHPQPMFSIQRTVHDHVLQRFGALGETLNAVMPALEVPEFAANQSILFVRHLLSTDEVCEDAAFVRWLGAD